MKHVSWALYMSDVSTATASIVVNPAVAEPVTVQAIYRNERVRSEFVQLFLAYWRGALIGVAVMTVAVIIIGQDYVPLQTLIIWSACVCTN